MKIRLNKISKSKKAVSVWVSWVLLVAFAVAMGSFMYSFVINYSTEEGEKIEMTAEDTTICEYIGINIDSVCQDVNNTQNLYINCTNNREIEIDQIIVKTYDLYGNSESKYINITLEPHKQREITVLRQNIQKRIELTPVVYEDTTRVICSKKTISVENPKGC